MTFKSILTQLSVLILLSACNSSYTTEVVSFHDLTASSGNKVVIVAGRDVKAGSSFENFANTIEAKLVHEGFDPANGAEADIVVTVNYKIKEKVELPTSFYWRDTIFMSEPNLTHQARLYNDFTYPTQHLRYLDITMSDKSGRVLFESSGISIGGSRQLDKILPFMLEALLDNFPGQSGTVKSITVNESDLANNITS